MKRLLVLSALALVVASCASAPKTAIMPDGRIAQMAYCDGPRDSMAGCFNKAAQSCGGEYEVISRSETADRMTRREIAYTCKG